MVKENKDNVKDGRKHRYCLDCHKKLLFPNKKGICFKCIKIKKKYDVKELKGLHNKNLSEFIK